MLSRILLSLVFASALPVPGLGAQEASSGAPPVIEMTAVDYAFVAPDTVPSGWATLRMRNDGEEDHLFALVRLPDGVRYTDYRRDVIVPYDSMWSQVVDGKVEPAEARKRLRAVLPDWYPRDVRVLGGVSLTAPGRSAATTVRLEPGAYVIECYVMTAERQYHALHGMLRPLTVVPASSDADPPEADHELTVANLELQGVGSVLAGERTFAVHFEEDPEEFPYQHLHLARLDADAGPEELAQWMTPDPVMPSPVEFLGGAQHMPAGNTAYVTVELVPGRYAWILGVPPELGEVVPFTVE